MMYYKKNKRANSSEQLGDILAKIVERPELSRGLRETRVIQAWPKVMGPAVARITTQLHFKNGNLFVSLNSSIIRSELLMHKDHIIESLNKEAGGKIVFDIILR
ncbi:DUF721 domain-containing protein [Geofilum sp. OHC36d9]|uniref:DUF721 domain-containing protein n=1 Tax=Geofilum sp. OHC36d9 TaxID=3458413 RepID=UPI0040347E6B